MKSLKSKKSQAWGIDLMVAFSIFLMGIFVFFIYSINYLGESKEILEDLAYDGKIITNAILSQGYPENWDETNVVKIGILNDNKINETKLEYFYNLAQNNYEQTKSLFNTRFDYFYFLDEDMTINSVDIEGIGKPGIDPDNIDAENIVKISRYVIYKDKPMTAYLYVFW